MLKYSSQYTANAKIIRIKKQDGVNHLMRYAGRKKIFDRNQKCVNCHKSNEHMVKTLTQKLLEERT